MITAATVNEEYDRPLRRKHAAVTQRGWRNDGVAGLSGVTMTDNRSHRNQQSSAERGASQTLILLVAFVMMLLITLVVGLSAAFFLSGGDAQTDRPFVEFRYDYAANPDGNEGLRISHTRGEEIRPQQLYVRVDDAHCTGEGDPNGVYNGHEDFGFGSENWVSVGNTLTVDDDTPERLCGEGTFKLEGATVEILFEYPNGNRVVLDTWSEN